MDKLESYDQLITEITHCIKCDLHQTRTHAVAGEGNLDADLFFIGEAPGLNEDKQGRPFVGRAGKILDDILASIELDRKDIYIANILKCRPPKNRNPRQHEIKTCTPYLERQLALIQPEVIIPMGSFSTEYIFDKFDVPFTKISKLHGQLVTKHTLSKTIHILPLYHPAVATYDPKKKKVLLEDIKQVKPFIMSHSVSH